MGNSWTKSPRILLQNLDHFRRTFYLIFIVGFLDGIAMFLFPLALAQYSSTLTTQLVPLSITLVVLYLVSLGFQWVLRRFGEAVGPEYALYLRLKYFRRVESLPAQRIVEYHSGYILSLLSRAADGLGGLTVEMFWGVAKSSSNLLLFFLFTARESIGIAFLNLLLLTLFVITSTILSRKMIPISKELNLKRATMLERYADFTSNLLTIQKLSLRDFAESELQRRSTITIEALRELQGFHATRWFFLHGLYGLAYLATILFMLLRITRGESSPAILILFIGAFSILRGHIERLSEDFKTVLELNAHLESFEDILDAPEPPSGPLVPRTWRSMRFEDISFRYPATDMMIHIPQFHVERGEWISISGASGQGKSTTLNIFANFLQPQTGTRYVDESPYSEISREFFRSDIAIVSQEVDLFNLTLRENLALGKTVSDDTILKLLGELDLSGWYSELAEGLSTVVGEKGMRLSSGQKQRLNVIRAFLLDRPIYLLDEPTAHLDVLTESRVAAFLKEHLRDKTVIIVSHRRALRELCTRFYRMRDHRLLPVERSIDE